MITMRGRNGNFEYSTWEIEEYPPSDTVCVRFYSHRLRERAPIAITGPMDDVTNLLDLIVKTLESIKQRKETKP